MLSSPTADSVDVGFAQDMSVHHQQAVQMASWERDHTTDPALKQLAFDIARKIESCNESSGRVKVTVVRETRSTETTK